MSGSSGKPSTRRFGLAGCLTQGLRFLRLFWVTWLVIGLAIVYGLYAGLSTPIQWSDAFFYAAVAQVFIAAMVSVGSSGEISAASEVRYLPKADIDETRHQLVEDGMRKNTLALRVFIGSLFTGLIAGLLMWVVTL